jgi:hypothetical protein
MIRRRLSIHIDSNIVDREAQKNKIVDYPNDIRVKTSDKKEYMSAVKIARKKRRMEKKKTTTKEEERKKVNMVHEEIFYHFFKLTSGL